MRLASNLAVAVVAGMLASLLVLAVQLAFSLGALRVSDRDAGGGVEVAYVNLTPALWGGLFAATAAFAWRWRRNRRPSPGR